MSDEARELDGAGVSNRPGTSRAPEALVGRTIDQRYRVEEVIGEGGMGLVYRVTHTRLNKTLAIKVIRRENTRDQEVIARFRREAESASAIGNQHIVDVSDFGMLEDGSTYFVMECLHGMDLIDAMDIAQRMPEERAIRIAIQLCKALGAAHRAGIVHRDLKPENVFLTQREDVDDFVKVLDFGIAKVANGHKRITRAGEVLGTPHYMSPEQCEGEDVDHRTDVYALGVLLYEMITGHVPHDADTMMGILTKHMYEDPIPPKVRVPQISDALEQVILRCLEKKPEQRYQTMSEIEADLVRIEAGQQPVGPDTVTLTPTKPPRGARVRVSPIYLGGLGMALLALAGALAMSVWLERGADQSAANSRQLPRPPSASSATETDDPSMAPPDRDSNEAFASADEAPAPEDKARHAKPARRKPKLRAEPQRHDTAILDPWE
ncbi:MAG: serine/threonine-protein kinase [Polyangiales bacterium]